MKTVETLWRMFLLLCEAREIADESWRRVAPHAYLRERTDRLVSVDRLRGHEIWQRC